MNFKVVILVLFGFLFTKGVAAQENDTLPFQLFKDRVILYSDLGVNFAPFSISDEFGHGVSRLNFRHNLKMSMGLGISYRWFALRVGFTLPGNLLSTKKYGESKAFDVGLKFHAKQTFWSVDFRNYLGYSIKNASAWNDTLSAETPNDIRPNTNAANFAVNSWWLINKKFNMKAVLGTTGHFTRTSKSWYIRTTLNFWGVSNPGNGLIPDSLQTDRDRTRANTYGAIDLGVVPGYAYGYRKNHWQITAFGGLGAVIQTKYYSKGEESPKGFLGVAPRMDFRIIGGYSKPKFFVLLSGDFDVKWMWIEKNMQYSQSFFDVRLIAGFRLHTKRSRESENDPKQKN